MNTEQIRVKLQEIFATEEEYDFAVEEVAVHHYRSDDPEPAEHERIEKLWWKTRDYRNLMYLEMKDGGSHRKNARIRGEIERLGIRAIYLLPWIGHYPYNVYDVHYEDEEKARSIGMTRIRNRYV